jgi:hypothetical protein
MECMDEHCPASVWEVSEMCAQCMIANQLSVEAMSQACAGTESPEN